MKQQKKRKKKIAPSLPHFGKSPSQNQIDYRLSVIRKLLPVIGLDADLFNSFTKKQRYHLLFFRIETPRVQAAPGHRIPRAYLNWFHEHIYYYYSTGAFPNRNSETGLTLMDMVTVGISFSVALESEIREPTMPPDKTALAQTIFDKMNEHKIIAEKTVRRALLDADYLTMQLTQMNYRIYGFTWKYSKMFGGTERPCLCYEIEMRENEYVYFMHNGIKRKGYRVTAGKGYCQGFVHAQIKYSKIYPEIKSEKMLPVYIQTHALRRFKERLDIIDASMRNLYILMSLYFSPIVIRNADGNNLFVCHTSKQVVLGYFTFLIADDAIFLTTLLPLTSPEVPEGRKLKEILGLTIEDYAYLGMDKLSFYYNIDFDEIPVLKNALIESGIWKEITRYEEESISLESKPDPKKTAFIKKYFTVEHENSIIDVEELHE